MKKRKPKISKMFAETLLPRRERDMLEIARDPRKMQAVLELGKAANNLTMNIVKTSTMDEWVDKISALLPECIKDKADFMEKFKEFTNEYYSKQQTADSNVDG